MDASTQTEARRSMERARITVTAYRTQSDVQVTSATHTAPVAAVSTPSEAARAYANKRYQKLHATTPAARHTARDRSRVIR